MTRYLPLLAVVCLALPAYAVEVNHEEAVLRDNPATKIHSAINKRIDKALADSEYCSDNPNEKKCVDREKARHDRDMRDLGRAGEVLKAVDKNPELKGLIERNLSGAESDPGAKVRAERREFLSNIKEMCVEASSEACKIAKQDYEEWKKQSR